MPKFIFTELVDLARVITARLGAGPRTLADASNNWDDKEAGKLVRQSAESAYNLCTVGQEIEGRVQSVDVATSDGWSTGGVQTHGRLEVTFDGLQGTPGTGVLVIGDYVVASNNAAKGTALTGPAKVVKATAAGNTLNHKWRVISLGAAGTGAVGTVGLIERI